MSKDADGEGIATAAITKYQRLGGLGDKNSFLEAGSPHNSGGWQPKAKGSAVGSFRGFSPWLINGHLLPRSLHGLLSGLVCVSFFFFL